MTPKQIRDRIAEVEKQASPPDTLSIPERLAWLRGHLHGCLDTASLLRVPEPPQEGE